MAIVVLRVDIDEERLKRLSDQQNLGDSLTELFTWYEDDGMTLIDYIRVDETINPGVEEIANLLFNSELTYETKEKKTEIDEARNRLEYDLLEDKSVNSITIPKEYPFYVDINSVCWTCEVYDPSEEKTTDTSSCKNCVHCPFILGEVFKSYDKSKGKNKVECNIECMDCEYYDTVENVYNNPEHCSDCSYCDGNLLSVSYNAIDLKNIETLDEAEQAQSNDCSGTLWSREELDKLKKANTSVEVHNSVSIVNGRFGSGNYYEQRVRDNKNNWHNARGYGIPLYRVRIKK